MRLRPSGPATGMIAACACGSVRIEASGTPIISVVCHCDDCQEGARRIEALPGAPRIVDAAGGTAYVAYRKDRVACVKGAELLRRYKIRTGSVTNRVVATCCNSALFLDFDDGKHWVDLYRARILGQAPPLEMHICTRFVPDTAQGKDGMPHHPGYPVGFLLRLLGARLAMSLEALLG
jgi:hypothetical protein